MRLARRPCRLATWLAAWAVLLSALLPALGHAARVGAPPGWGEVCTTGGLRSIEPVAGPSGDADPTPSTVKSLEHCLWCSLHTPVADLPPAKPALGPVAPVLHGRPRAVANAPHCLLPWMRAQPRAPPRAG